MYHQGYGIIKTEAPLHLGATAGEETGNINLIFRDQFTQTGIIPGSSIRGRFRALMRYNHSGDKKETEVKKWYGNDFTYTDERNDENNTDDSAIYSRITESLVKFDYASIIWLPVFCPGQPIVWVSCPRLLKRYKRITGLQKPLPSEYSRSKNLVPLPNNKLFFNFGFLSIKNNEYIDDCWFPNQEKLPAIIVRDNEISMIHDMALYRQSRVALEKEQKCSKNFFGVEALPEETFLVFPIGIKKNGQNKPETWKPFAGEYEQDQPRINKANIYFGGLESVGFGYCEVTVFIQ